MPGNIVTPAQLVHEFKKSGEFDRLRRDLLQEFKKGDSARTLLARVNDITRQKLETDRTMRYMSQDAVHAELMQELERYPLVERAVADTAMLSDPAFPISIRRNLLRLLGDDSDQKTSTNVAAPDKSETNSPTNERSRAMGLGTGPPETGKSPLAPAPQSSLEVAEHNEMAPSSRPPLVLPNGIHKSELENKIVVNGSMEDHSSPPTDS